MQPGGEGRFPAKRSDLAVELQERFLGQIFGLSRIRGHAQAEGIDPPLVLIVEGLERLGVALFRPFDQSGLECVTGLFLLWVGQVAFSGRTP